MSYHLIRAILISVKIDSLQADKENIQNILVDFKQMKERNRQIRDNYIFSTLLTVVGGTLISLNESLLSILESPKKILGLCHWPRDIRFSALPSKILNRQDFVPLGKISRYRPALSKTL
jgi:hypothetical protein